MNIQDLYPNVEKWEIPDNFYQNIVALLPKIKLLEIYLDTPLKITSGFRTWKHHLAIYQAINDARIIQKKPEIPVPLHSAHLSGNAVDIEDASGNFKKLLADEIFLNENELWSEGFQWCPGWIHCQQIPYGSFLPCGSRFFRPF